MRSTPEGDKQPPFRAIVSEEKDSTRQLHPWSRSSRYILGTHRCVYDPAITVTIVMTLDLTI